MDKPSPLTPSAVVVDGISKTFPGQLALDNVHLRVLRGRVHALLGQNGSGKSTLIKILTGFHDPDPGGKIYIGQTLIEGDRAALAYRLGLRCVYQDLGLIDEFDAVENFGLTSGYPRGRLGRIAWGAAEARVTQVLGHLGVEMDVRRPVGMCAPVERTAVAVARAIADLEDATQGCLLLDEPTAALSRNEAAQLFLLIDKLKRRGVAVIYVSHRLDEILEIADDLTVLRGGNVVRSTTMASIRHADLVQDITGSPKEAHRQLQRRGPEAGVRTTGSVLEVSGLVGKELAGVSFSARAGEVLGVAGLLGSGRSELGPLLAGYEAPVVGSVMLKSEPRYDKRTRSKRIAYVPSDRLGRAAIGDFSVRENMTLPDLRSYTGGGVIRSRMEVAAVGRWIQLLNIVPADGDAMFTTLSGGNQQKVVMSKWLALFPDIPVVDEPTAGADVGARARIYDLLRDQVSEGLAVVACSSDVDELAEISDRVLVLRSGSIAAELVGAAITPAAIVQAMSGIGSATAAGSKPGLASETSIAGRSDES
jgi:ribose transport system ATP-binding protein